MIKIEMHSCPRRCACRLYDSTGGCGGQATGAPKTIEILDEYSCSGGRGAGHAFGKSAWVFFFEEQKACAAQLLPDGQAPAADSDASEDELGGDLSHHRPDISRLA